LAVSDVDYQPCFNATGKCQPAGEMKRLMGASRFLPIEGKSLKLVMLVNPSPEDRPTRLTRGGSGVQQSASRKADAARGAVASGCP
jgi:hypothetical protein